MSSNSSTYFATRFGKFGKIEYGRKTGSHQSVSQFLKQECNGMQQQQNYIPSQLLQ